ncbi:MAG: hypothetical protein OEM49_01435 [Myxococcales bacterium]|nr:hypothetical protein [Myxococcales bacterium]
MPICPPASIFQLQARLGLEILESDHDAEGAFTRGGLTRCRTDATRHELAGLPRGERCRQAQPHGCSARDVAVGHEAARLFGNLDEIDLAPVAADLELDLAAQRDAAATAALGAAVQQLRQEEPHGFGIDLTVDQEVHAECAQSLAQRPEIHVVDAHPEGFGAALRHRAEARHGHGAPPGSDQQIPGRQDLLGDGISAEPLEIGAEPLEDVLEAIELSIVEDEDGRRMAHAGRFGAPEGALKARAPLHDRGECRLAPAPRAKAP